MLKLDTKVFPSAPWELLMTSIICNVPEDVGATDKGMTDLLERCCITDASLSVAKTAVALEEHFQAERKKYKVHKNDPFQRFEFSSKRKRMSTIISNATGAGGYDKRLLCKGASEYVVSQCSHYLDTEGVRHPMSDSKLIEIQGIIKQYAEEALRTIAFGYRDLNETDFGLEHQDPQKDVTGVKDAEKKVDGGDGLTLVGVLGIYDIIRSEVPGAIATCQKAGVIVRMITGDNLITAKAIAAKCGLITEADKTDEAMCIEGPEFFEQMGGLICTNCNKACPHDCECKKEDRKERVKNLDAFKKFEPKMRVMARSRPEDKYLLVTGLMNMKQVVAVTGDGTNDAPALSKADVGFGMNIAGTEVCKKAADIIIMDDSFNSVVKACMWGRNIYDNIRRFL